MILVEVICKCTSYVLSGERLKRQVCFYGTGVETERKCRAMLGQAHSILNVYSMMGLPTSAAGIGQHLYGSIPVPPSPNKGFSEMKKILTNVKGGSFPARIHPAVTSGLTGWHDGSLSRPTHLGSRAPLVEPVGRM